MAIVICDGAELIALKAFVGHTAQSESWKLRLFKSNTTPAETDTLATYTPAAFTGYAEITLTSGTWSVGANPITYAQQTFTSTANQTTENIYGYYYARTTGADLIGAERFSDAPYPITNNGDAIKITPSLSAD